MARFLLVHPEHSNTEETDFHVPVGPLQVCSYLDDKGLEVIFVDCSVERNWRSCIRRALDGTLAVGLSVMTTQLPSALKVAEHIRELSPNMPIIWGGVHASLFPAQVIESGLADLVIIGEGELPLSEVLQCLAQGWPLIQVAGLAFRNKDGVIKINDKPQAINAEQIAKVNYSLLSSPVVEAFAGNSVGMTTSRGCLHPSFCGCADIPENHQYRYWDSKRICGELERLQQLGVRRVIIWDENFFLCKERIDKFVNEMERRALEIEWSANVWAEDFGEHYLSAELVTRLCNVGWRKARLVAETGVPKLRRPKAFEVSVAHLQAVATGCGGRHLDFNLSFTVGMPQDDLIVGDLVDIIDEVSRLLPGAKSFGRQLFRPYPGSVLYQECLRSGWDEPETLRSWAAWALPGFGGKYGLRIPKSLSRAIDSAWLFSLAVLSMYRRWLATGEQEVRPVEDGHVAARVGRIGSGMRCLLSRVPIVAVRPRAWEPGFLRGIEFVFRSEKGTKTLP